MNIRGEYTKTKVSRYSFLTREFIEQYQEYLKYKYRKRVKYYETRKEPTVVIPKPKKTDLLFASYFIDTENKSQENENPDFIYNNLLLKFEKTLDLLDVRYENSSTRRRRRITFHSLRRSYPIWDIQTFQSGILDMPVLHIIVVRIRTSLSYSKRLNPTLHS